MPAAHAASSRAREACASGASPALVAAPRFFAGGLAADALGRLVASWMGGANLGASFRSLDDLRAGMSAMPAKEAAERSGSSSTMRRRIMALPRAWGAMMNEHRHVDGTEGASLVTDMYAATTFHRT